MKNDKKRMDCRGRSKVRYSKRDFLVGPVFGKLWSSFVVSIPKNFRKTISVALRPYYIQLSLTVLFLLSMSGKFANYFHSILS